MFYQKEKSGYKYFVSDLVDVNHAFSTKGMNAKNTKDRKKFCDELGFDFEKLIMPTQEHTSNIVVIKNQDEMLEDLSATDGVIISVKDAPVMLVFADCVPVLIYSKEKQVMALLHAGWKGTASKIVSKAIGILKEKFRVTPSEARALIGAGIGQCCYEVSNDVKGELLSTLAGNYGDACFENKINLKKVNEYQLIENGVVDIDTMDYCTSCDNDLFYSYRKNNKTNKRHAMVAVL